MIYNSGKPKPIAIIRAIALVENSGTWIFNDKLKDGRRSIKVWGWTNSEYKKAVDMLRDRGYNVSVRYKQYNPGQIHRIWIG